MASSARGPNWETSDFCRPHTQKQMQNNCVHNLYELCSVLNMFIFMLRCRWHIYMHLTNHCYFDYGNNLKMPNLSPMPAQKWRRFWNLPCIICGFISLWEWAWCYYIFQVKQGWHAPQGGTPICRWISSACHINPLFKPILHPMTPCYIQSTSNDPFFPLLYQFYIKIANFHVLRMHFEKFNNFVAILT